MYATVKLISSNNKFLLKLIWTKSNLQKHRKVEFKTPEFGDSGQTIRGRRECGVGQAGVLCGIQTCKQVENTARCFLEPAICFVVLFSFAFFFCQLSNCLQWPSQPSLWANERGEGCCGDSGLTGVWGGASGIRMWEQSRLTNRYMLWHVALSSQTFVSLILFFDSQLSNCLQWSSQPSLRMSVGWVVALRD